MLCLMCRGFFQSPTTNDIQVITEAWVKDHPHAIVVPVSSVSPVSDKQPQMKQTFVWLVDGGANLNLELVKQGCFGPETQTLGEGQKLEIAQADYDAFVKGLGEAGQFAKDHKVGIYGEPRRTEFDEKEVMKKVQQMLEEAKRNEK